MLFCARKFGRNRRRAPTHAKVKRAQATHLHRVLYLSHQMRAKVCCPVCPLHFILIVYARCCCYSSSNYCTISCVALPLFSIASYSYRPMLLAFCMVLCRLSLSLSQVLEDCDCDAALPDSHTPFLLPTCYTFLVRNEKLSFFTSTITLAPQQTTST
jgi:hypothetical protein